MKPVENTFDDRIYSAWEQAQEQLGIYYYCLAWLIGGELVVCFYFRDSFLWMQNDRDTQTLHAFIHDL